MLTTSIVCFAVTLLTSTRARPDNSRYAHKSFAANAVPVAIPVASPANPVPVANPPVNSGGDGGS
jgi:hypothetical protein